MSTTQTPEYTITTGRGGVTILWQGQSFEVEVEDLEAGGWEFEPECERDHCDDGDCDPCPETHLSELDVDLHDVLRRWHDDNHEHALRFCDREPCRSIASALGVTHRHG